MSARYRVSLRGCVPDTMLHPYLDEYTISRTDQSTTLAGSIIDAAQLHGLISYLTNAGLEIIELTSTELAQEDNP